MNHDPTTDDDDLLWGAAAIARHIGRNMRRTYYLLGTGAIPHRRLGARIIVASRRELDAALGRAPTRKRLGGEG